MTWILLRFERLAAFETQKAIHVMQHQNSVFHSLTKHVPWARFERLVENYGADKLSRKLTSKRQLLALLFGQFSGATSLRDIVTGLESHQMRLYHVGGAPVKRSTMSDANRDRPCQLFGELFAEMLLQAHRGLRRATGEAVRLIDSTSLRLSSLSKDWAEFSAGVCGAKVHVVYDPHADYPVYFSVTQANVNDITAAKAMPIEAGATYVFDLGYYDYGWWAALDSAGCRIVTRFKANTPLAMVQELPIIPASNILSDRIGFLPARQARSRRNPMQDAVREVRIMTETGKVLRILSNDLDAPAEELADLYRRRWAIELFFRWVKQTLKITRFVGTSENAIRIQIAVALIAFLLLRLAQAAQRHIQSPIVFARLIRTNLMHRRQIDYLLTPAPPILQDQRQMSLHLC